MTFDLPYVGNGPGQFSSIPPLLPYKVGEWVLLDDLIYTDKTGRQHNAPKYFITDLASIPWITQPIFNSVDTRIEGVGHDWLYCFNQLPRAQCDALLREMLLVTGCDSARAELIYAGVRVGGSSRYTACTGGPKREDFAWEYMTPSEVKIYESAYKLAGLHV
ncbi:hypothetical protein PMM47T1_13955 [Pseudomonas sp. M47T1]|uniref:DUF1353 domain-containing protein n=1 Tax=Pseudomonas sp. M47T1 TaxID=1179778 RepID=UPI0002608823|nr:DUF1353 domain-containing protein [Pseudomonas sp. M47T1]EIK96069.1 hypothetical protein PMM47T1_13955 [Pseudomonas sp. M47T1]